jgi:hypothetical protein
LNEHFLRKVLRFGRAPGHAYEERKDTLLIVADERVEGRLVAGNESLDKTDLFIDDGHARVTGDTGCGARADVGDLCSVDPILAWRHVLPWCSIRWGGSNRVSVYVASRRASAHPMMADYAPSAEVPPLAPLVAFAA